MGDNNPQLRPISRRNVLGKTALGLAGATTLAGCSGGGDSGDGGETNGNGGSGNNGGTGSDGDAGFSWPRRVDIGNYLEPGAFTYALMLEVTNLLPEYIDADPRTNVHAITGAGGMELANLTYTEEPDGSWVAHNTSGIFIDAIQSPDRAAYSPEEFSYLGILRSSVYGLHVNWRTQDVDDWFQWTWDDFVEKAPDLTFITFGETHTWTFMLRTLFERHPDLDQSDLHTVHYGGGAEARAAMEREDADVYCGSFGGSALHTDADQYYHTQFLLADPETQGGWVETCRGITSEITDNEPRFLSPDVWDSESRKLITLFSSGRSLMHLPPEPSDEVYDAWVSALDSMKDDPQIIDRLDDFGDHPELLWHPEFGREAEQVLLDDVEALRNNEDFLNTLFED